MKKLSPLHERALERLPEFGDMPIEARRRAWRDASREMRLETILLYTLITIAGCGVLFPWLWFFGRDPGWRGDLLTLVPGAIVTLIMLSALHVLDLRRIRRRLRARLPHLCSGCGYNLTGNTSGVCPECGRPRDDAGFTHDARPK